MNKKVKDLVAGEEFYAENQWHIFIRTEPIDVTAGGGRVLRVHTSTTKPGRPLRLQADLSVPTIGARSD